MRKHHLLLAVVPLTLAALLLAVAKPQDSEASSGTTADAGQVAETAPAAEGSALMGEAVFPHEMHIEDLELACEDCHHEINAGPLSHPHEDYFEDLWIDCQVCHHQSVTEALAPQPCSSCHHPLVGGIADETLSAKVVVHQNCWSCHDVGTGVDASQSCSLCHQDPE